MKIDIEGPEGETTTEIEDSAEKYAEESQEEELDSSEVKNNEEVVEEKSEE